MHALPVYAYTTTDEHLFSFSIAFPETFTNANSFLTQLYVTLALIKLGHPKTRPCSNVNCSETSFKFWNVGPRIFFVMKHAIAPLALPVAASSGIPSKGAKLRTPKTVTPC